jgi:hypothetical protein
MLNNSNSGDVVYEPFLGSGTTLIAAESTGRVCLALELDPLYVDVAVRRWQAFAGKQAILIADGRAFDAVASEQLLGLPAKPGTTAAVRQRDKKQQSRGSTKRQARNAKRKTAGGN